MKLYNLNGVNEIRIWLNSCDELMLEKNNINKLYEFNSPKNQIHENHTIIAELFLPRGARVVYGVLGANYKFEASRKLSLTTHQTLNDKKIFKDSLLDPIEEVYVGLPEEYEDGIYSGVKRVCDENKLLLTGNLDFCYAAHAEVSSSSWVFQKLAYIISNLFCMSEDSINRENLILLLEQSQTT